MLIVVLGCLFGRKLYRKRFPKKKKFPKGALVEARIISGGDRKMFATHEWGTWYPGKVMRENEATPGHVNAKWRRESRDIRFDNGEWQVRTELNHIRRRKH